MGIAKHYYTLKSSGRRIDAAVKRFFGENTVVSTEVAQETKPKVEKPKKEEKSIGDILQNLLEENE